MSVFIGLSQFGSLIAYSYNKKGEKTILVETDPRVFDIEIKDGFLFPHNCIKQKPIKERNILYVKMRRGFVSSKHC